MKTMKKKIICCVAVLIMATSTVLLSQETLPREYVPETELVSLNSDLDLSVAMDLLSEYAIRHAGKPIYDPEKRSGAIGVDIRTMPWKSALEMILSRRGLWYSEKEHYFQVIVPDAQNGELGADSIVKMADGTELRFGYREVKIEAVFFEGNRKTLREIGIDWSTFYNGDLDISADQLGALQLNEDFLSLDVKIPSKLYGVDVEALLRVFDSMNIGEVIAQPQITVMEGKEGKIQVGQDFSIKTRDFAGNIIDRFFSTGTILMVTPYVLQDDKKRSAIFLTVHVERSQAYPDAVSTIIDKSEANSHVQLFDGEETLIAGLYSTESTTLRKGIPILKDLPWWVLGLRYIFGYSRDEDVEKELVIILKASLLPEVFARLEENKANPSREDETGNSKFKIHPLKSERFSFNGQSTKSTMPANSVPLVQNKLAPDETDNAIKTNEERSPVASVTSMEANNPTKTSRELYRGIVTKLQNELALIEWERNFKVANVVGENLTVLRKSNGDNEYHPIGKVKILKAQNSLTVGKRSSDGETVTPVLQIGDWVVANY